MATKWCDRMRSAAEGDTVNVCDGHATVRVDYTWDGHRGTWVATVCDACADAMATDAAVDVFAVRRIA